MQRSRLGGLVRRLRGSLFVVPMLFVIGAVGIAFVTLAIDRHNDTGPFGIPLGDSTVDNARAVLTTVAAATIGFAGIAFSVSLLVVQMASSQYSPRVVHGLLRDPFSKRVMGAVVGTFTFCLVVLRAVRGSEDDGESVVASLSVTLAVVLGILSILATIAFINHSAHAMDVSELLQRVTDEAVQVVEDEWSAKAGAQADGKANPPDDAHRVTFGTSGWVQHVDRRALLTRVPAGTTVLLETEAGRYAVEGTALCRLWPTDEADQRSEADEDLVRCLREAVEVGDARTGYQDVGHGIRLLADVALTALSPGVNDPTTAQDAIFHLCAVLRALLVRQPPDAVVDGEEGRRLVIEHTYSHRELVELAFEQIRRAAATDPTVCVYLLEAISLLCDAVEDSDVTPKDARDALLQQAQLVVIGCQHADNLRHDVDALRASYRKRFGDLPVDEKLVG